MSYENRLQNSPVSSSKSEYEDYGPAEDAQDFDDKAVRGAAGGSKQKSEKDTSKYDERMMSDANLFVNLLQVNTGEFLPDQKIPQSKSISVSDNMLCDARRHIEAAFARAEELQVRESVTELAESKALREGLFDRLASEKITHDIRFSIEFSSGRSIDVEANNMPDKWDIALIVSDPDLKKRLQESHENVSSSLSDDFSKNVNLKVV